MNKTEIFIQRAKEIHGNKYDYSLVIYIDIHTKVKIIFNNIIYLQTPVKHLMGRSPEKNTPRKTTEQFIEEAIKVWGNKYDYSLTVYNGALKKIKIIYMGVIYEQRAVSHLNGLAVEIDYKIDFEMFIKRAINKHGNKYDYSKVVYIDYETPVLIGFNGIYYLQAPKNHLIACPEKILRRKTTEQFVEEANLVHNFSYNYDKSEYIKNTIKIIITCHKHGDFKQLPQSHLRGNGCPRCSESKGEKQIHLFLESNNIEYFRQHKFKDCKNVFELAFDFYIPSVNTIIEYDGKQHYEPIKHFGGKKTFKALKYNDSIKNEYCKDNYINLIRIKYTDFDIINDILNNNLSLKQNN